MFIWILVDQRFPANQAVLLAISTAHTATVSTSLGDKPVKVTELVE